MDSIVFIGFKRHNVTSHRPIFSIIRVTKLILIISLGEIKAKISKLPIKKNTVEHTVTGNQ